MPGLKLTAAGLTDTGKVRSNNEDAVWVDPAAGLMIVADGMGGHQSGEVASGMAVKTIPENLWRLIETGRPAEGEDDRFSSATNRLGFCLKMANSLIFEMAKAFPRDRGMGTTCTAVLVQGNRLSVAHVGDSRAYLIRKGDLQQLTTDHSLVMEQVSQGIITREEAAKSDLQNILTRALGMQADVKVDLDEHPLFPGDRLLLCSDGLFKALTEKEIEKLAGAEMEPGALARLLIQKANDAGGPDNVTVAVGLLEKKSFKDIARGFFFKR